MCRRRRLAAIVIFRFFVIGVFTILFESLGAIGRVTETLAPGMLSVRMDGTLSFVVSVLRLEV